MKDVDFIKKWEGCKLTAYQDVVGIWTIGYGHTGKDVRQGLVITQEEADTLLNNDLWTFRKCVDVGVTVDITVSMRAALCSLAYNIGCGAFSKSTVLRKVNAKDWAGAANAFLMWNKAGGKVIKGLENRRKAERNLFLSELPASENPFTIRQEDKPMLPFIAAALPALLNAAPDLIRVFGGGEQSEKNAKAAEKVVDIAKAVTGETTAEGAVAKIQTDPAMTEAFAQEARAQFLEIEELAEKRVAAAREFNKADEPMFWRVKFVHILSLLVAASALIAIGYILVASSDATERSMALQTLLVVGMGGVMGYWIGSSQGSDKKTDMMNK
ncbi:MAG: lysozyme [Nitrospinae bacterium]|nr:lysozyme [Nitrospinota bacterium]